ncbi:chloroplast sensor kinase, chloroplastic isoform X1 [Ipomoea triloba]|uniref:chloroplast sensor kinase, chloroplastic isoform X1 n=1 Tax=Ipomoea triloba TaxID=35885 RepID=UPI00125CF766|nr:chloroplast sensor kinase, chloroplastic isoform X1 [Ipomoea triloba]
MLLSLFPPQTPLSSPANHHHNCCLLFCPTAVTAVATKYTVLCRAAAHASPQRPTLLTHTASSFSPSPSTATPDYLRQVSDTCAGDDPAQAGGDEPAMVSSASAVAAAIRNSSSSPVEFVQVVEKDGDNNRNLVLPSPDFQSLCLEQLDLFRRIVHPEAIFSVYVRPAGSYVMDRLELRRITLYPGLNTADIVILIGTFSVATGLRAAEAALSNLEAELLPELGAVVFPMVKHPFVVGFLVAELPTTSIDKGLHDPEAWSGKGELYSLPHGVEPKSFALQTSEANLMGMFNFSAEQRLNALHISRSIAMAYVMDQKAILLQQSSWQNNVRMSNLVEQIRSSLSSMQTLSKMLSVHTKKNEVSYDIVEDILEQGDSMRDTLQQMQDAVHLTKANITRFNEDKLKKMHQPIFADNSYKQQESRGQFSLNLRSTDQELPMPPLALAPLHREGIRPCNMSNVLTELVEAMEPIAHNQQRAVELCEQTGSLHVAVEEPALRQALGNLIEGALLRTQVGGKVEVLSTVAPAGGALVVIDDDGLDMHYMTQMHSLAPFGADLLSEGKVEDSMTWNFVAGLTVAQEILETYGCVVRVISPRTTDIAFGAGGTRVEIWFPSLS